MHPTHDARTWRVRFGEHLTLDRPRLMAILNVTPDSFSDGGAYLTTGDAKRAAITMMRDGATIIDVGGESTRPGAAPVAADEQIRRTAPVISAVRSHQNERHVLMAIDTTSAMVAEAALNAGADIINDVSAGLDDSEMFSLAAARGCGLILMHRLQPPRSDSFSTDYPAEPDYGGDVYGSVRSFLASRLRVAIEAGVDPAAILIDPGLGFGKSVTQNYALAARLGELQRELDRPVLSAVSRKSFLARPPIDRSSSINRSSTDPPLAGPGERLGPTVAFSLSHWQMGVRVFRVHDVRAHALAFAAFESLRGEQAIGSAG